MKYILILLMTLMVSGSMAQGQRMNLADRMDREKKMLYDSIADLSDDQKLLIDQVYLEVSSSVQALQDSGDMALFREKLPEIQEKKVNAFRDIMSEEQFARFEEIREQMRNRMRRRGNRDNQ